MTALDRLVDLLGTPDAPLGQSMLLLSEALTGRPDAVRVGTGMLDELAAEIDTASVPAIVHHLFDRHGFHGDTDDYHAPENSLLDRVLERRIGMPITLSAVVAEVGHRHGIDLHLVGMPGHVLVGCDSDPHVYIDAFAGRELDEIGVRERFASIFGAQAELAPSALAPIDTRAVIGRVCNNLTRSWIERDPPALNRLLDVRAALAATARDKQMLIGLAEGRGRFDLAARLRTEVDPSDPTIDALWGRLN